MKLSILDLAPIPSGTSASDALGRVLDLARLADSRGFERLWYAEHHGLGGIASSVPDLLIAHAAAATSRIRLGSGGVMLPNHAALSVAERYHTLAALHPGRIDLGIGRAAGTDPLTAHALGARPPEEFSQQLAELRAFSEGAFPEDHPYAKVSVVPGDVPLPPVWLLGSSGASATLAGRSGVGYAFAQHFSPTPAAPAMRAYRKAFSPSEAFPEPHAIVAASVFCAPTREEAQRLASPMALLWHRLRSGAPGPIPSPEEADAHPLTEAQKRAVAPMMELQIAGDPPEVLRRLTRLAEESGADEVMVTSNIHDHAARLRSYALLADAAGI